jgi:hypothetical protein
MNSEVVAIECGQKGKGRGRKIEVGVTQRAGIAVPCTGTCSVKAEGRVVPVHAMKACGEVELYLHELMTLSLDGDEWSALRPGRFIPKEKLLQNGLLHTKSGSQFTFCACLLIVRIDAFKCVTRFTRTIQWRM